MKKSLKKILPIAAFTLTAVFALTACGTGNNNQPANTPAGQTNNQAAADGRLFNETFHINVVQAGRPIYDDDNMVEMAINDMLNVHVHYMRIPESTLEEQLGILLASRDLPDIVYFGSYATPAFNSWKQQGAIIALDGLLEQHGQDITSRWRNDDWSRVRSDVDGLIYGIPAVTDLLEAFSVMLRADWLENLGLEIPSTIDEWVTVLEAVRDGDPRGDGSGGAIPYAGLLRAWENAFGIQSTPWQVYNGQYLSRFEHPNYIEYITFMQDMYSRGLIDPEYFTRNTVLADIEALFFGDHAFATEQWTKKK
jgi:putative aldouronate transport system substrate-binding protein